MKVDTKVVASWVVPWPSLVVGHMVEPHKELALASLASLVVHMEELHREQEQEQEQIHNIQAVEHIVLDRHTAVQLVAFEIS